ncbi:unnamed protein product [Blepharisma stoltei]|uniref:Receptor ligand binding region domain-containing protein n=1 Tax=Blepharisma stoltei TaxID=1481888 RepID=A0AAU9IDR3_9CILI|nr:unnamed protein product [Blepharisma stoltei]
MWIWIGVILVTLYQVFCQLLIEIAYSNYTDLKLKSTIYSVMEQKFSFQVELNQMLINSVLDIENLSEKSNIILDITFSASISELLREFTSKHQIIHISTKNSFSSWTRWQYFTHFSNMDHLLALSSLVSFVNWQKFIIIFDESTIDYIKVFKNQFLSYQWVPLFLGDKESQDFTDAFVGKQIKPIGIRNIIISSQGKSASKLVKSLKKKNLMINGTGIILGSRSWSDISENGIFGFIESGLEKAIDYYSYEALACVKLMDLILSFPSNNNNVFLRDFLERNTINHHPIPIFTIMNSDNSEKRSAGTLIDGVITWNNDLVFIGNSSSIPNSPTTQVNIWIADGSTNPGFGNSTLSNPIKQGARYALLSYAEKTHFLDGFDIILTHTDCGAEVYDPAFSLNCFSKIDNPGVAFMTTPLPFTLIGNLISLKALNISMPVVSEYATPQALENEAEYPQFMRIAGYDLYHTSVLTTLINVFGWENVILILENSTDNAIIHDYIAKWAEDFKINIVNEEKDRWIMQNYNHTRFEEVQDWMKKIIEFKIRPILFYVTPPFEANVIIDFYEAGLRQGDCIFLLTNRVAFTQDHAVGVVNKQRLGELLYGGLVIMEAEYIGEYGKEILKELQEYYYPLTISDFKCLSFDAAMLILHGIKYTLSQGENIEDSSILNTNLRLQKFLGCSGTVSIESGSNNRNSATLGIYNIRWNQTTNLIYESLTGVYNIGSKQLFTFFDDIVWYSNSTILPDDKIVYDNGCPFYKSEVRFSSNGAAIFYSLSAFIFIATLLITLYIWKKCWYKFNVEPIKSSRIQLEDYIAMAAILIDFFQFLSLGPEASYDRFSSKASTWFSINVGWLNKEQKLWVYVTCAMVIVALWVLFCIQIKFKLFDEAENLLCSTFRFLSKLSLTIIGNLGFLPIFSVLLSSLACYESIGSSLKQTFVHQDCSTFCWQNQHIIWAALSIISLVIYLPSAIYFRPFADVVNNGNIKTKPLFLMAKGVFQVSIIILSKTLKVYYESLHGLVYILLLSIFVAICLKLRPYNYGRMNLWLVISYLAVIWGVTLSSIYSISPYHFMPPWIVSEYIGWIILIAVGLYFQSYYCPSMLFTEKNPDIGVLFRFELGNSVCADKINKSIRERTANKGSGSTKFLGQLNSDDSKDNLIVDIGKNLKHDAAQSLNFSIEFNV